MPEDRAANHAAYRRLKDEIARAYEQGRFVAIASGRIVADAENFYELRSRLVALGKDSPEVLVVQAGVDYPETAVLYNDLTIAREPLVVR